jgi:hypothetical protein
MTYTDPPGVAGATEVLVNDLDLNVTDDKSIAVINEVRVSTLWLCMPTEDNFAIRCVNRPRHVRI